MKIITPWYVFLLIGLLTSCKQNHEIIIFRSELQNSRTKFGIEALADDLSSQGFEVQTMNLTEYESGELSIIAGTLNDSVFAAFLEKNGFKIDEDPGKEGFHIRKQGDTFIIAGKDANGTLYGCLELRDLLRKEGHRKRTVDYSDKPEMTLRGTCIGLQKTEYLPGRRVYEYPYTPDNFPWFYDKELWIRYLDMMVENRFNSLYLWNGHPFASLIRLEDYPYAVEVDEETFRKNEEIFSFLTREAEKRGIWVIQMFYNIIVSKPFAEHHGLVTQDRSRPIIPVISDYTRKSIAAFIEKYPNVGLMVCLGEAMRREDDVDWFVNTIIPGVRDGLNTLGISGEPPIVLRGHDTDPEKVMKAALPVYKNLYTTHKYNGESLTTYQPQDSWKEIHQRLSALGSVHIANVHILANLEPFRYGSPDFIQKSVEAMYDTLGANGLHLYPQASYWDWPYSADKAEPRLLQIDRDWIWYEAWGRYAWDPHRSREAEIDYWTKRLDERFGAGNESREILRAYEETGEIAPKLLRQFGISDGNRQTLLLGMFMGQLVNPEKYHVYPSFRESSGPDKELLIEYAEKEWNGESHTGETPPDIIKEVVEHAQTAVDAIDEASGAVMKNSEEFNRLKNDVYCYNALSRFFAEKVKAAMLVLQYQHSRKIQDLENAIPYLENSLEYYEELVNLTRDSYLYANSMQTSQRRIPITGADGKNKTWEELLPHYRKELANFRSNVQMIREQGAEAVRMKEVQAFEPVSVTLFNGEYERYPLRENQQLYKDNPARIVSVAEELQNLSGIRFSDRKQQEEGTHLRFRTDKPVKILTGYFNTNSYSVLRPPTLETNATAGDHGQADIKIANAMLLDGLYPVNVYSYYYESGEHELVLDKGRVLILGFIDGKKDINIRDAGLTGEKGKAAVDWLFY